MASQTTRNDPYSVYRFRVEIDGIQTAAFSEATVPNSSSDSTDYREGTDPPYSRKLSGGPVKFGTLTLKKGITSSMDLYNWRHTVEQQGAGPARKNITITLLDDTGADAVVWNLYQAWPSHYESSELNATSTDTYVETLEIQVENIERVK